MSSTNFGAKNSGGLVIAIALRVWGILPLQVDSPEQFGLLLCGHFLSTYKQVCIDCIDTIMIYPVAVFKTLVLLTINIT